MERILEILSDGGIVYAYHKSDRNRTNVIIITGMDEEYYLTDQGVFKFKDLIVN